jgi:hypothetical protein
MVDGPKTLLEAVEYFKDQHTCIATLLRNAGPMALCAAQFAAATE